MKLFYEWHNQTSLYLRSSMADISGAFVIKLINIKL